MTKNIIEQLRNSTVIGSDGEKIGKVGVVYIDAHTSEPTFVTVNTGLFGGNESFVPVNEAKFDGDEVAVPYTKDFVKDAPNIAEDGELSPAEEQRLYEYYSVAPATGANHNNGQYTETSAGAGAGEATAAGATGAATVEGTSAGVQGGTAAGHAGDVTVDEASATQGAAAGEGADANAGDVVAHEEHLNVSTTTSARETGQVRLRKVVHTDTETVEVPVRREEIVVERTEVKDGKVVDGYDFDSAEASTDVTVTAHEERPVVETETVATERVSVGKEVHTDTEKVSADVRKEEIIVEGDEKK